jgi:hypothetical protein
MDKKCGTCQRGRSAPQVGANEAGAPLEAVPGRLSCEHYKIIVHEDDGKACEHWMPHAMGPKLAVEQDGDGNAKIVVLRTKTEDQRSNCIAKLSELLEEAKNGNLRDVLIITFRGDDEVTMHWTPMTDANGFKFVGALSVMANLLTGRMKLKEQR